MSKYKVSIIVPVYGVEKYIAKCLNSLVHQTLDDIEIIVVNDGSKDGSQVIVDEFVSKYPDKVKSFIKENGGQGSARNYGLLQSKGEYVGYVDGDDFVELDMYEKLYKQVIQSNADIVICGNYNISEDYSKKWEDSFAYSDLSDIEKAFFGRLAVWNKIYKRSLLIENNITFKEKVWYEDVAFTLKALISATSLDFVDLPLYNYLIRQGSTMNNSNVRKNLEILDAFDDVLSFIKENHIYGFEDMIEFLAIDHVYVSGIVRVLKSKASIHVEKDTIYILKTYMMNKFPNYANNKYINLLPKNRKVVYTLLRKKMYWLVKLIFMVKEGM